MPGAVVFEAGGFGFPPELFLFISPLAYSFGNTQVARIASSFGVYEESVRERIDGLLKQYLSGYPELDRILETLARSRRRLGATPVAALEYWLDGEAPMETKGSARLGSARLVVRFLQRCERRIDLALATWPRSQAYEAGLE